jgi:hypothetical protein
MNYARRGRRVEASGVGAREFPLWAKRDTHAAGATEAHDVRTRHAGRMTFVPPSTPKPFRIDKRRGGFAILPNGRMEADQFPMQMRVRCAYDILSGNPYKRYSEYDFSFYRHGLQVVKDNADWWPNSG